MSNTSQILCFPYLVGDVCVWVCVRDRWLKPCTARFTGPSNGCQESFLENMQTHILLADRHKYTRVHTSLFLWASQTHSLSFHTLFWMLVLHSHTALALLKFLWFNKFPPSIHVHPFFPFPSTSSLSTPLLKILSFLALDKTLAPVKIPCQINVTLLGKTTKKKENLKFYFSI